MFITELCDIVEIIIMTYFQYVQYIFTIWQMYAKSQVKYLNYILMLMIKHDDYYIITCITYHHNTISLIVNHNN